jgi:hypothetical protein
MISSKALTKVKKIKQTIRSCNNSQVKDGGLTLLPKEDGNLGWFSEFPFIHINDCKEESLESNRDEKVAEEIVSVQTKVSNPSGTHLLTINVQDDKLSKALRIILENDQLLQQKTMVSSINAGSAPAKEATNRQPESNSRVPIFRSIVPQHIIWWRRRTIGAKEHSFSRYRHFHYTTLL